MAGKTKEVDYKTAPPSSEPQAVEDVAQRSYYYDDAHGYEEFDPDETDAPDDESSDAKEN